MFQVAVPWECRDKEDQARAAYHNPLRRSNVALAQENLRLKRLLRQHGIPWSDASKTHLDGLEPGRRKTRASFRKAEPTRPSLPTEVLLRIIRFAMTSPFPIIDPLSTLSHETISDKESDRGNQIAIHCLAACRAMHAEGTRYLWELNDFVFTSPQALQNFCGVDLHYRKQISHITLRVVARYYDDQRRRHKLELGYHEDLKKDQPLKVYMRPRESPLVRGGFRCYTWNQVIDFLISLRPPYDPSHRDKSIAPPRLLPNLTSIRLDLVNFSDALVPFSGSELHHVTSHELGCSLNELQITGMPFDDAGMKAAAELSGMLKDEGLYLDGPASFVAVKKNLKELSGSRWCSRVIRAWKAEDGELSDFDELEDDHNGSLSGWHRPKLGILPPAPKEEGHPASNRPDNAIIWKRVPLSRDSTVRQWVQFSRYSGYELDSLDGTDGDGSDACPCCGESHAEPSFLNFLMENDDEYISSDGL